VLDSVFAQPLSKSSLVYLLVWYPPLTSYISSPNDCLLFATHAHTIVTCFAVVPRLRQLSNVPQQSRRSYNYKSAHVVHLNVTHQCLTLTNLFQLQLILKFHTAGWANYYLHFECKQFAFRNQGVYFCQKMYADVTENSKMQVCCLHINSSNVKKQLSNNVNSRLTDFHYLGTSVIMLGKIYIRLTGQSTHFNKQVTSLLHSTKLCTE